MSYLCRWKGRNFLVEEKGRQSSSLPSQKEIEKQIRFGASARQTWSLCFRLATRFQHAPKRSLTYCNNKNDYRIKPQKPPQVGSYKSIRNNNQVKPPQESHPEHPPLSASPHPSPVGKGVQKTMKCIFYGWSFSSYWRGQERLLTGGVGVMLLLVFITLLQYYSNVSTPSEILWNAMFITVK